MDGLVGLLLRASGRTKSALSDEAHIRPVGHGFDDGYISLTRIDIARRGLSGASQNELYTSI